MSQFFVGQRVRKARGSHAIGVEGVVVEIDPHDVPQWSMYVRTDVAIPRVNPNTGKPIAAGCEGWTDPALWEPIQPEGARPSEFETLRDLLNSFEGVPA